MFKKSVIKKKVWSSESRFAWAEFKSSQQNSIGSQTFVNVEAPQSLHSTIDPARNKI